MFIVIEGLDGAGKSTQTEMLKNNEDLRGFKFLEFPNYNSETGRIISSYLSGEYLSYGCRASAYSASLLYAMDRYFSYCGDWKDDYDIGTDIVAARYVTSNAIYQSAQMPREERADFVNWVYDLEYTKLEMPKPDKVIFLDVPLDISMKLLEQRNGTDKYETIQFQRLCRESAWEIIENDGWTVIKCAENGEMRGAEDINKDILREIWNLKELNCPTEIG